MTGAPRWHCVWLSGLGVVLVMGLLLAGCAELRPYRVGRMELEGEELRQTPASNTLPKLPEARPLAVGLFTWHAASPVGLKMNFDRPAAITPIEGTYYGRGVHVTLFEAVFDALKARRRWIFRDYMGATQPGLIPQWARAQRFLVLDGEIIRFEHSKWRPSRGVPEENAKGFLYRWGHEGAYAEVRFRLRDAVSGKTLMDTTVNTWTSAVHTENPLAFNAYRSLGVELVRLLEKNQAFMAALGGGR